MRYDLVILITGSRDWEDHWKIFHALEDVTKGLDPAKVLLVEGEARGADIAAGTIGLDMGFQIKGEPARWRRDPVTKRLLNPEEGTARNLRMIKFVLAADADRKICLAFPLPQSRGTFHCMRAAEAAGIEVRNLGMSK